MQPVIAVRDIVNRFGSQSVHDGVSFDVFPGEIFGVVGGSGTGKSVLLRTILGLRQPTSGTVQVEGVDITGADDEQLRAVVLAVLRETSQGGSTPVARSRSSFPDLNVGRMHVPGYMTAGLFRWLLVGGGATALADQVIEARIDAAMPEIEALVEQAVDRALDRALEEGP